MRWAQSALQLSVAVVRKRPGQRGFQVLPRRWVVERSFAWISRRRRLARDCARDYERRTAHAEAMVDIAAVAVMTRRLARLRAQRPLPAATAAAAHAA